MDDQTCLSPAALDMVTKIGAVLVLGLTALFGVLVGAWKIATAYLRSVIDRLLKRPALGDRKAVSLAAAKALAESITDESRRTLVDSNGEEIPERETPEEKAAFLKANGGVKENQGEYIIK